MKILNKFTVNTLKKNRSRTIVTIIGIILSVSMFTAVTTTISSLQNYLLEVVIATEGGWQGQIFDVGEEQVNALETNSKVNTFVTIQNMGYAKIKGITNESKPYLYIGAVEEKVTDLLPINLTSGTMPKNSSEILIPKHLQTNGGVKLNIGDRLSLDIGERHLDSELLLQHNSFVQDTSGDSEEFLVKEKHTYTVVGFYERPNFEEYSSPGYTALTVSDGTGPNSYTLFISLNEMKEIYQFMEDEFPSQLSRVHSDLLRYNGASNERNYNSVLYRLASVLMAIIMFGSISLIYNAFSISLSERTRQFGMIKSIGATNRQMMKSVYFEVLLLSLIGIPLGLLAGITGIGITLTLSKNLFSTLNLTNSAVDFGLFVSPVSLLMASALGLLTVFISAFIPAKRAIKTSTLDSIRQTKDIKINPKKVKTSNLVYSLFSFEGMIASKNFKRNKKQYRATVISLFMSIVLFISASSFSAYLTTSLHSIIDELHYDLSYDFIESESQGTSLEELYLELKNVKGVENSAYLYQDYYDIELAKKDLNPKYLNYLKDVLGESSAEDEERISLNARIYFIEDESYEKYLSDKGYPSSEYMNKNSPLGIASDFIKIYNVDEQRYYTFNILNDSTKELSLYSRKEFENYSFVEQIENKEGQTIFVYKDQNGEKLNFPMEEAVQKQQLTIGGITEEVPFYVDSYLNGVTIMYPYSSMNSLLDVDSAHIENTLYFKSSTHKELYDKMFTILEDKGLSISRLTNYAESLESSRAMVTVVNIFSYGFIVLISLIAAANVFNTITTNITLRRREFAMLKSIGMTPKSFMKMMNFECILYGLKGLVYGIPVAMGVTYLIYLSVLEGWETSFFVPCYSIAISVASVFTIVFSTMLYSTSKIKSDNTIEALKNENI